MSPPFLEHIIIILTRSELATVKDLDSDLLKRCFNRWVHPIFLSYVISLNALSSVLFEKEFPNFFIKNIIIVLISLFMVDILIKVFFLQTFDRSSSIEIYSILIVLSEVIHIHHRPWMIFLEVIRLWRFFRHIDIALKLIK